jgi:hypothetical protein
MCGRNIHKDGTFLFLWRVQFKIITCKITGKFAQESSLLNSYRPYQVRE